MMAGRPVRFRQLHRLPLWARAVGVLSLVLAAAGLDWFMIAPVDRFLVLVPTIIVAGVLFGRGAAIAAALLAFLAGLMLLVEPVGGILPARPTDALTAALFLLVGLLVAAGTDALLAALERADSAIAALAIEERRHRALAEAGAVLVWRADPSGAIVESRGWERLTGQPEAAMRGWGWLDKVHPEDRERVRAVWAEVRASHRPRGAEFRVQPRDGGEWRWVRARAAPVFPEGPPPEGEVAEPVEWMGVLEDVQERRQAERHREILAREVDHRARNLLSVVQAVLRLTPRGNPAAHAEAVERRIAALGRAHALLAEARWEGADLRRLAQEELAAYGGVGDRAGLDGPRLALAPEAAQAFSMVLHELATNAAKYGALLTPTGRVRINWRIAGHDDAGLLHVRWEETGGPPPATPSRRGFGSRVIEATIIGQLGGRVERRWEPAGLICDIRVPLARVLAGRCEATQDLDPLGAT
jgi:PAS domain S-box-containing protein